MTENKTTSATITESGYSPYAVAIAVSGYHLEGDGEVSIGGGGLAPAPYDFLLAALGECTAMTMRWYAIQQNWPLDKVEVKVAHHKEGRQDIFNKTVTIYGPALTEEQRKKLIDVAGKCPVQRTLENSPTIMTTEEI